MALVTERVVTITSPSCDFTGSWAYDDQSGDVTSLVWRTPRHGRTTSASTRAVAALFTVQSGASATQLAPRRRFSFARDAKGDWAPDFIFSVYRA